MNTKHTILMVDNKPAFVVIPYDEYLELNQQSATRIPHGDLVPHEVVKLQHQNNWSLIRAWREYLGFTQQEMAEKLNIRQPSYAKMEALEANPRRTTLAKIAEALNLNIEQLRD